MRVWNYPALFDRSFIQRLTIYQPTDEALHWLESHEVRNDVHMTRAEVSLDWVFDKEHDKQLSFEFACRYLVKSHHRDQGIRFVGEDGKVTRYTGPRSAPNVLSAYADRHCKVTGEIYCMHLEWRMQGSAALRQSGIHSFRDLNNLDPRQFWAKRLKLRDIDSRALGRMYHNQNRPVKRRRPWIISGYDLDAAAGSVIVRALGSTQAVIDRYRQMLPVNRTLRTLETGYLLPCILIMIMYTIAI